MPPLAVTVGELLGPARPPALFGCALTVGVLVVAVAVVGGAVAVVTLGTVAVGVVGAPAVGVVAIVVVTTALVDSEPPTSLTSAAASTPSASAATTAIAAIGAFQFGVAASRVRAAAPQRKHQSCCESSGAPHSGHASLAGCVKGSAGALGAGTLLDGPPAVAVTVTTRPPAGG
jgi:hypothetical protein